MVIEDLVAHAAEGDEEAWAALIADLWPQVESRVRRHRSMGPYRRSPDDCREVASLVFARLRHDRWRALRTFGDWRRRHAGKAFHDWLHIVTANVVRDFVADKLGSGGAKRLLQTLTETLDGAGEALGARPPITNAVAAGELEAIARASLPAAQHAPLASWLHGHDFDEVARRHGMNDAREARALVRAALARLRRSVRG